MDSLVTILTNIRVNMSFISLITLNVIGVLGNTSTLFIFTRKNFRPYSTNIYLACLSVFSTIRLGYVWFHRYPQVAASSSITCKLITMGSSILFQYCNWIPVLTSLDRFIAVRYPFYFNLTKKRSFQFGTLFGLFSFIVAANAHIPVVYDIVKRENASDTCSVTAQYSSYMDTKTISLFNLILLPIIIPFALMTVFTVLFTLHLFRSKAKFKKSNDREVKFARMLIGLNVYFLICNLPFGIAHFFIIYFRFNAVDTTIVSFVTSVFSILNQGNNALHFIVYFITNKLYRGEVVALLFIFKRQETKAIKSEYSAKADKKCVSATKNTKL